MKTRLVKKLIPAAGLCLALLWSHAVRAADVTVVNNADGGAGSLRQALVDVPAGGTIDFAPALNGQTILLASAELVIAKNLTLLGPGAANLAVDGNAAHRVFHITPSHIVSISGLTITNGHVVNEYGGGIYNESATLTVSNCSVSGNSTENAGGGGIANYGNSPTLMIINSTLSGNSVLGYGGGGGISMEPWRGNARLEIVNSTLSGNSTLGPGGGIYNFVDPQSDFGTKATVTIRNSTLSGNSALGPGAVGGGIYCNYDGEVEIQSTILKEGSSGPNIFNDFGTITSLGLNLSSDGGGGLLTGPGDQINTDPLLGPLQDNGGPTFTHALLPGSPAINAGTNALALAYDQRGPGFPRNVAGTVDIGAFEVQTTPPSFTACGQDLNTTNDFGQCDASVEFTVTATGVPGSDVVCTLGDVAITSPYRFPVGTNVVNCTATNIAGTDTCSFTVIVSDVQPPVVTVLGANPLTNECHTAFLDPGATASDNCAGSLGVATNSNVNPDSVGSYTISYVATDPSGPAATNTRIVWVVDTTPPAIPVLADVTGECSATITDAPTTTDNCAGLLIGTTTNALTRTTQGTSVVTWTFDDGQGHVVAATQNIVVRDVTPPRVSCPGDLVVTNDAGLCSAVVRFEFSAEDNCAVTNLLAEPASGSSFPKGTSTVTVTATDLAGNTNSCNFTVTVRDAEAPVITCSTNRTVEFTSAAGAPVAFFVPATDNCLPSPLVVSVPASGSTFPIGTTTVNSTATDAATNRSTCSFTVTVLGAFGIQAEVLTELIALHATVTDKEDGQKLDEAIERLTRALAAELWVDQIHVERKHGDKVFDLDSETVHRLCDLIKRNDSDLSAATLQGFIDRLFRADRLLASVAIDEAVAAGVAQRKIDQAREFLAKVDAETTDDKCDNGIGAYKEAWKHALRAKLSLAAPRVAGTRRLEVLGEPGERMTIEASTNLLDWETLGECRANGEGVATFADVEAGRYPVRYYRTATH